MTIGAMKLPKKIPNLNQILFSGLKIFEFKTPKTKKIKETENAQILTSFSFIKGHKLTIKKTIKKIIPKLRLEPILILFFINSIFNYFRFLI